jgi:hypothetical protein
MIGFYIALAAMVAAGGAFYWYRDKIAALVPGWKHGIAAATAFALAVAQYLQAIDYSKIISDPATASLVGAGVGLLVLVLSWITPRSQA